MPQARAFNLQAAGALINYDLPGIPQGSSNASGVLTELAVKFSTVRVANLFIADTVDVRVYQALRRRCGLFERFVGSMQPVLEHASRMLLGRERPDPDALDETLRAVQRDVLSEETYVESRAEVSKSSSPGVTRTNLVQGLLGLGESLGFTMRADEKLGRYRLVGPQSLSFSAGATVEALERDSNLIPLSPLEPEIQQLVQRLSRPGERLPLVIGSSQRGAFRASIALWIVGTRKAEVTSFSHLARLVEDWDGLFPEAEKWQEERGGRPDRGGEARRDS